ncbi:MAG: hypothetical protein IIC85_13440 [Chloroflexi bacterium]|nr:hypothetical protein [Chloroflexota bacterium]
MAAIQTQPGDDFEGTLLPFFSSSWEPVSRTTHFPNAKGESEIRMGHGGRTLQFRILLHKGYDQDAITRAIQSIHDRVNEVMTLTIDGWDEFPNCTLKQFITTRGPLEDLAGTLDEGWWAEGILIFRQLAPKK